MADPRVSKASKGALFLALLTNVAAQSLLLAVLPPLGRRLGFSDIQTAAILSFSALILIVAAPFWGYLSERIGRRPVLLIALAAAGAGPAAFGAIVDLRLDEAIGAGVAFGLFFAARAGQTLVAAGLQPTAQAYIADVTGPRERTGGMGFIGAAYGLGAIAGALLVWQLGSRFVLAFGLMAGLVGGAFVLMLLLLAEPDRHGRNEPEAGLLPFARIWPFFAITLVAFAAYSIVQQVMALRFQDALGFSSTDSIAGAGMALLVTALAMVVVQGAVMRLFRGAPEHLLLVGAVLGAATMLACGLARTYSEIIGVVALFGAALGCIFPGNLASLSLRAGAGAQGKAAGLNMVAQGCGLALGPLTGAALHQLSPQMPFFAAAALLAAASGLAVHARRQLVLKAAATPG